MVLILSILQVMQKGRVFKVTILIVLYLLIVTFASWCKSRAQPVLFHLLFSFFALLLSYSITFLISKHLWRPKTDLSYYRLLELWPFLCFDHWICDYILALHFVMNKFIFTPTPHSFHDGEYLFSIHISVSLNYIRCCLFYVPSIVLGAC